MYCKSYSEQYGLDCTILRFGIPFGPRARAAAVVPAFVKKALSGEPLTIAGDGSQGRRFVYVEDLADGVARGLAPEAANRVYNLVGDETVTVKQIARIVQELIGNVDILHVESRAGDFSGTEVSGDRAARELGWMATTPFTEGVRRYIDWLRGPEVPALNADAGEPDPVG
jgi:UDP-glucose 4-epimerase